MLRILRVLGLALAGTLVLSAVADDAPSPAQQLAATLGAIESMQGRFTQRQFDERGELLLESSGEFRMLRPGYFSWEIQSPDSQIVIANPQHLWHYDRDLETATRRPVTEEGELAPLKILGGDLDSLHRRFDIEAAAGGGFVLRPREPGLGFRQLQVSLEGPLLASMQVTDDAGQQISIEFLEVRGDAGLVAADFNFTPPPHADVFYHDR
ncbi:MAG: outer membrane lipoprotein chaperone LolA [Halioglobus sp.]|nr:outer membrane lipoprotein chaperone LolA [Halioglobus sp.]